MNALAKCWTWIGFAFVPFAAGWIIYLRGGLSDQPPPLGVLISRGYAGLLISLVAGCALIWVLALYVRAARKDGLYPVPPNTMFEEMGKRHKVISWVTLVAFIGALLTALVVFSVRYSESSVHAWNDQQPLASSFWDSRVKAQSLGCSSQPCFAMGKRMESAGRVAGVFEYIPLITDGALLLFAVLLLAGTGYLLASLRQPVPRHIEL